MKTVKELLKDPANWPEGFQTSDGMPVKIAAVDLTVPAKFQVLGFYQDASGDWFSASWNALTGRWCESLEHPKHLIPRPVKRSFWTRVYKRISDPNRLCCEDDYPSHDAAKGDGAYGDNIFAIVEVACTEGEGL